MGMWATYYSDIVDRRSCVYRLYDAEGELLYVGLTTNPLGRVSQHRSKQPWGKQIAHVTEEWHPDRESAKAAERSAIHHENPIFNVMRPRMECC